MRAERDGREARLGIDWRRGANDGREDTRGALRAIGRDIGRDGARKLGRDGARKLARGAEKPPPRRGAADTSSMSRCDASRRDA
jgi:hypothetical protein